MKSIVFRSMVFNDIDIVLENEIAAMSHPWSRRSFVDGLLTYDNWLLIIDNKIIGHAILSSIIDELHLLNFAIHPLFQQKGFGKKFLSFLMEQAKQLNAREFFLEVRASNDMACSLYERYGFNEIARRANYYPTDNGGEDAIVMVCTLF